MAGCPDSLRLLQAPSRYFRTSHARLQRPMVRASLPPASPLRFGPVICTLHVLTSTSPSNDRLALLFYFPFLSRDLPSITPPLYPQHRFCFHPSKHLSFSALTGNSRPYQSNSIDFSSLRRTHPIQPNASPNGNCTRWTVFSCSSASVAVVISCVRPYA